MLIAIDSCRRRKPKSRWSRCTAAPIPRQTWRKPSSDSRGGETRRADCLSAGAVSLAIFLPERRSRELCSRGGNSGTDDDELENVARDCGIVIVASLFEKRSAGRLPQHRRDHRCRWAIPREIPQDAHPGRSVFLREVLLRAGRSWFPGVADAAHGKIGVCVCWDQWYPESARLTALARRADSFLSDGDRLASEREGEIWRRPTFRLGNDAAQSRDRERLLCRGDQPRRSRSSRRRRRDRVLGAEFRRRAERRNHRERQRRSRRNRDGRDRLGSR